MGIHGLDPGWVEPSIWWVGHPSAKRPTVPERAEEDFVGLWGDVCGWGKEGIMMKGKSQTQKTRQNVSILTGSPGPEMGLTTKGSRERFFWVMKVFGNVIEAVVTMEYAFVRTH